MSVFNPHMSIPGPGRPRRLAWLYLCLCGTAACGVIEYPHDLSQLDPTSDFGPSSSPSAGAGASAGGAAVALVPQPMAAGATGTGQAGAPMTAGSAAGNAGAAAAPAAGRGAPPIAGAANLPAAGAAAAGMAAPPPAAADALNLGGTNVAKQDVIAFIHFGHSNMAGRATGPTATRPYFMTETDPHAWMYHVGKAPELAKEPYTAGDDLSGTYGGPGTALVKQAVKMAPSKYFMSLGFGRTSAYCSQFLPGSLYYDSLSKAAIAIKDHVTFGAIVIMLGITERHGTSADISGYTDCINKLVTAVRKDVGRPDLPLLITDYEQEASGLLAINSSFAQMILPQIRKIPSVVSNSVLVPTDGLGMQDDHHFNFDGHKVWTQRVLDLMKSKGWFPWAQ
jgi:hypothetical protein